MCRKSFGTCIVTRDYHVTLPEWWASSCDGKNRSTVKISGTEWPALGVQFMDNSATKRQEYELHFRPKRRARNRSPVVRRRRVEKSGRKANENGQEPGKFAGPLRSQADYGKS